MFDIELKLQLSPQSIAALNKSELLSEPHVHRSQHAIYFDTADHKLFNARISLRIRKEGVRLVQTVKCAKAKSGGLFRRAEWEILIDADTPSSTGPRQCATCLAIVWGIGATVSDRC